MADAPKVLVLRSVRRRGLPASLPALRQDQTRANMSRRNEWHSFSAAVRGKDAEKFVRIVDRYWPGGPSPEYGTLLDLEPHEAHALGKELIDAAKRADAQNKADKIAAEIRTNTTALAAAARAEAET